MPYKSEKIKIEFTKNDRRIKLTEQQRQDIKKEYSTGLISHRGLAAKYKVSKKTIFNILNESKYKEQLEKYKQEQHSKQYYNKEKHKNYMKKHRKYKQDLFLKGVIKMNYKQLENELSNLTKQELINFIDDYDSYIAEFISDNQGLKLIDDVMPENIILFWESHYLNKEVF